MHILRLSLVVIVIMALLGGPSAMVGAQEDPSLEPSGRVHDLLPGAALVTEEVEPGVFHVVSDGIRELSRPIEFELFDPHSSPGELYRMNANVSGGLAANQDDVWLDTDEGIVRLGEDGLVWARGPKWDWWDSDLDAAPDGTLYRVGKGLVFDGQAWRGWPRVSAGSRCRDAETSCSHLMGRSGPKARTASGVVRGVTGWCVVTRTAGPMSRRRRLHQTAHPTRGQPASTTSG